MILQRFSRPLKPAIVLFACLLASSNLPLNAQADPPSTAPTNPAILVLGDSLSAGYGLNPGEGWVSLLEQKLGEEQLPHQVFNASVSGETTAGGLARLPALIERHAPQILLVELGANDGLRALPIARMKENLGRIAALGRDAGARVALFEMRIPSNYGPIYTEQFVRAFGEVADAEGLTLVPFLLQTFASELDAFQEDGIHPAASAQPRMLQTIWPAIEPLLKP